MTKEILLKALELMAKNNGCCEIQIPECNHKMECYSPECIKAIVDKYICMAMEDKK